MILRSGWFVVTLGFTMIFAHPLAWGLLLLAIPIIAFFFLKIRFRTEIVSTSLFWQQIFEERRTRRLRRRFRHLLSLLLALFFLGVLTAAALDPAWSSGNNRRCVVIIDHSSSMNAHAPDSPATRLDLAKRQAKKRLGQLAGKQQIAIVTANHVPKIMSGFTPHLGTLQKTLAEIPATDSPADWTAVFALTEQLIAEQPDSPVYLYTDADLPEERIPQGMNLHLFNVGQPIDNVAITRFQPRRLPEHAADYEIFIEAVNFGAETIQTRLEIELDGKIIDVLPLTLASHSPVSKLVRSVSSGGGVLRAALTHADFFQTDNSAAALLSEQFVMQVLLYGTKNFFLEQVLQAQSQTNVTVIEEIPHEIPPDSVLVCHQTVPSVLPSGHVMVLDPQNHCDFFRVGERLEQPIAANVETKNPLVRFSQFSGLVFSGARQLTAQKNNVHVLAATADEFPLYMQFAAEHQKTLVLSADLSQGDFALRTTFPILMSQALAYFRQSEEMQNVFSTAEPVTLPLQTEHSQVILRSPSGRERVFPCTGGQVSLGSLGECGVWTILEPESRRELTRVACHLMDAAESDLRPRIEGSPLLEPQTLEPETLEPQPLDIPLIPVMGGALWYYLACLALFTTVLEWFLYQRRWIE